MSEPENPVELIHTRIWKEIPEDNNPFAAAQCFCAGYDVYEEVIHKASWFEYLYLLFKSERPTQAQAALLEKLAISIAHPGIRDHSVRAAMNAGVGGSTSASALMAALAVGAGQSGGAREVYLTMQWWQSCGLDMEAWGKQIQELASPKRAEIWLPLEHAPGFDPHGASCATPVIRALDCCESISPGHHLAWLKAHRITLEQSADMPLAMTAVMAAALADLEFTADQGEMLCLLLRLPGAAVHALEQKQFGWKKFPFFGGALKLTNDPGPVKEA